MFCGKCGAEVPDGYEFCMKCGAKIEPDQMQEPNESKPKKKKWLIPVIAIVCVIAVAIGAIYFINDAKQKSGLYNNMAWGTSFEDVKEIVDKNNGDEEVKTGKDGASLVYENISKFKNDDEISALVIYDCKDGDVLQQVQVFVTNGEKSKYTDEKLYDKYESEFTKLYGDSKKDTLGVAWTTKKSKIKLIYMSDGMLIIDYSDINRDED